MLSRLAAGRASSLPRHALGRRFPAAPTAVIGTSPDRLHPQMEGASSSSSITTTTTTQSVRYLSSGSSKKFRPRRFAGPNYRQNRSAPLKKAAKKPKGKKDPNDVTRRPPKIDLSNIKITEANDDNDDDNFDELDYDYDDRMLLDKENELLHPFQTDALQMIREGRDTGLGIASDVETQLRMMDYYTSAPGSTEDLVGQRRALALETLESEDRDQFVQDLEERMNEIRIENMDLPKTHRVTQKELEQEDVGGADNQIPPTQLAHGDWGEMLVRTDRVCKMWRGGRIESYRALVIGGNLYGCGGFGIGKSFEPEDAVEIASRMAKRNIFFVDRYKNRTLTRDLVGRQNSCKVILRTTNNGLRGNPLCCEILKLFGITNVVAKAHGRRSHHNVVRATFKALMTHESLEDIAMKRGVRLINLQKAKRLQI